MTAELVTLRDLVRYAVTEFTGADLAFGHGVSSAYEDAFYLVFDTLRLPLDQDPEIYWDARVTAAEKKTVLANISTRITKRIPTAYITGRAYLQGLQFQVTPDVLIPRSFIAEILGVYEHPILPADSDVVSSVLDLCTGSGCLAILAAHIFPNARVDAVELSNSAFAVAQKNVAQHKMQDRVHLFQGDLYAPLAGKKYDLIITNPPYVTTDSMQKLPAEYKHEPEMALVAGADGLDLVHKILADAKKHLNPNGLLICEIGAAQNALITAYPNLPFVWFDTVHSSGEVFGILAENLP